MPHRLITVCSALVAITSLSLLAAEKLSGHTPDMNHSAVVNSDTQLGEGGQATFAALIEIVAKLEQDAKTDWGAVDLDSLREHLLDMNHLVLDTVATKSLIRDTQIQFEIRGTAVSIPSIHRMVPAHSKFIRQSRGWTIESVLNDDGAMLTITVEDKATMNRINALGFYGFMSLDSHHQSHHYQIAIGKTH